MYIHLGKDFIVKKEKIIGIFDMDNTTSSKSTRAFLSESEENGLLISATDDIPRSFIVCDEDMLDGSVKTIVYLSALSPKTLKKRSNENVFEQISKGNI